MAEQNQENQEQNQQPNLEDVFSKLMGGIFKAVLNCDKKEEVKEEVKAENIVSENDGMKIEIDVSDSESEGQDQDEDEDVQVPTINDFISIFGKSNSEVDKTINNLVSTIKTTFVKAEEDAKIKSYLIEQLETCSFPEAKKNTIEKFNLGETAEFVVTVVLKR